MQVMVTARVHHAMSTGIIHFTCSFKAQNSCSLLAT